MAPCRRIDRSIAVDTKEVAVEQLRRFNQGHPQDLRHSREPGCPANNVTWLEAVRYCNWLSKEAGLEECYEIRPDGVVLTRAAERFGYRLPTEAEAEFFGRGGYPTAYPFGDSAELLPKYAWILLNSGGLTRPVGRLLPNEFGVFDAQGNVMEDAARSPTDQPFPAPYPTGTPDHPAPDPLQPERVDTESAARILRGGWCESPPGAARPAYRHGSGARLLRLLRFPRGPDAAHGRRPAAVADGVPRTAADLPVSRQGRSVFQDAQAHEQVTDPGRVPPQPGGDVRHPVEPQLADGQVA